MALEANPDQKQKKSWSSCWQKKRNNEAQKFSSTKKVSLFRKQHINDEKKVLTFLDRTKWLLDGQGVSLLPSEGKTRQERKKEGMQQIAKEKRIVRYPLQRSLFPIDTGLLSSSWKKNYKKNIRTSCFRIELPCCWLKNKMNIFWAGKSVVR